ncbi:MAG: rotamase [SAR86 cluster bacterium]|jgi:peptidyl-prolyl cis-trans isomerase SurA|uniref:Chaperone SurA n=1 Tax=SAR86 cluster bacterium TaxID=2030880 RepID=A0A520MZR7_9GAMM|nr:MAG: rotamase [SAR86 cluster bacterium]|tara:strand:+ start:957 stop:2198 length:1242 start_codon:yes stop_codon:yes gene_type:complete
MKKLSIFLLLSIALSVNAKIELLDRIAIIVEDGVVMESQIISAFDDLEKGYKNQNIQMPPKDILMNQVMEKLIIDELQLQLADRAGIKISDSELNQTFTRLASNNQMSLEDFILFIENNGDSYEEVREQMRKEMRIQRIQRGRVNSNIDITENEFEAFMATNETLSALDPELLVRQILVKELLTANKIVNLINENVDFSELAKEYSISSNASEGGLLSWRKAIDMPDLFEKALEGKSIGYVSEPLESGSGFHILKLEDKRGDYVKFEDQWQSRHILMIPSTIRDNQETEKQINNIRQEIIDGQDFAMLASEFSEDPGSAQQGGDLGWIGLGVFAPEFEKVMLDTQIGSISEVFETEFGFHFLEVLGKRNHELTEKLIQDRAYGILYARKFDEELENTLRSMRAEAFVEFKDLD